MRLLFIFLCLLLVTSCAEKTIEEPKNLIPQEIMSQIIYDISIINSTKGTNPGILKKNKIEVMPFIYKKYKIDSIQFTESDLYYASIPSEYQSIYETAKERIEADIKVIEDQKKVKADSIKKVNKAYADSIKASKKYRANDTLVKK